MCHKFRFCIWKSIKRTVLNEGSTVQKDKMFLILKNDMVNGTSYADMFADAATIMRKVKYESIVRFYRRI